ncbi:MAG TPA: GNAT family N-acetyltransferase [Vicinamibacterales bacterium]
MILRDWRDADAAAVRDCYERERQHWLAGLSWDTTWTWATVEQARVARGLPGFLAVDGSGQARGWAFFVLDEGTLHIGGLVADSDAVTRLLLDGIVFGSELRRAAAAACFVLDRARGLAVALADHGFVVEPFHYLSSSLDSRGLRVSDVEGQPQDQPFASWHDGDVGDTAALLEASYSEEAGRHFAADGNWERYVTGLVDQAGCGVFDTSLTALVRDEAGLQGAALVTCVSPSTAHLAQLVVRPECRGRGLASRLTRDAAARAAAAGKTELTLLVGEQNQIARHLYAAMGFTTKATFLAARREGRGAARYVAAS